MATALAGYGNALVATGLAIPADVHTVHMAAALAGCRKALVSTGLALTQTGVDKAPLPF